MKLWYSIFDRGEYKGNDDAFYNPNDYQFSEIIEQNFLIISKELNKYLETNQLPNYFNTTMVSTANTWKTISLKTWDVEVYENHKYFPETLRVIQSINGLVSASFTLLEPYGHIKPHCGDTNGIFRCHLGLSIPDKIPACGFRVKNEWRSWEEGKILVFVDANNHEAINNTNQNRFLFLFDIVRPEVLSKKRMICATVLTSLYLQKWAENMNVLYKSPMWLQLITAKMLVPLAYIAIPVRNFLYKIKK